MQTTVCSNCGKPLTKGGDFCPFCGEQVISPVTDAYIQKTVDRKLESRLQDQTAMVRELADKVEDVVWKRFTRYTVLLGLLVSGIIGAFTFFGITTYKDASGKIAPVVQAAVRRAERAKQNVDASAARIDGLKGFVDQLSATLDAQTRPLAEKNSEISKKLADFDAAKKKMDTYEAHSGEVVRQLDGMQKSLETKVQQISNQVDDISVRRAFPGLGQTLFVTLDGKSWRNKTEKKPAENWVNVYIAAAALSGHSAAQIDTLMKDMKTTNYTPIVGLLGVGGPYFTGFGSLNNVTDTEVVYFQKSSAQRAAQLSALTSRILSQPVKTELFDPASLPKEDTRRFVIEQSGLDLQLVIAH